jgi:hypothetical protein
MSVHNTGEEEIVGVTRDPILRPVGALMVVVGALWALFVGMASEAGTLGQPLAALGLIALGVVAAGAGKAGEQT